MRFKVIFRGIRHGSLVWDSYTWELVGGNGALVVASLRQWFSLVTVITVEEIGQ